MSLTRSRLLVLAAVLAAPAVFGEGSVDVENGKADLENGKTIFAQRCAACHAVSKEPGGFMAGPNMVGLIGRKAGSQADFQMYSPALKAFDVIWSAKTLDEFLASPLTRVPGTTMPMVLPDDKERGDVIAYLSTLK